MSQETLQRAQRRQLHRIEEKAKEAFAALMDRFQEAFIESDDPGSSEFEMVRRKFNSQWVTYAKRVRLTQEAQQEFNNQSKFVIAEYIKNKEA